MSSLVAYEDSESEDESLEQTKEGPPAAVQFGFCEQNQEVRVCNSSEVTLSTHSFTPDTESVLGHHGSSSSAPQLHSQLHSCFDWERKYCSDVRAQEKQFRYTTDPLSSHATQGKISAPQPLPHKASFSDGLKPEKRHHSVPSVVRPYIPKRQRLATSVETADPKCSAEQVPGTQIRASQILSEVSPRVKPYLAHKPGAAGIPRRLLMSLGGHQGPVNTVQWCPVPHLSHLLLSASMDKTFKVWDGAESGRCLRVYTCHSGAVRDACWTPCGRHLLTGSFDNSAVITDVETGQQVVKLDNQFKVMCVVLHPSNPEVFLCGGYSSVVKAWDSRSCKVVKAYKAGIQQTLDILFLRGGVNFITSSDCVSRDSADRTLVAWDYETTAKVSNQIYQKGWTNPNQYNGTDCELRNAFNRLIVLYYEAFVSKKQLMVKNKKRSNYELISRVDFTLRSFGYQERYTCPSLALHPLEESFVAQTNGNYVAVFSSQQPYRMNKRRRYEGHKVSNNCGLDGGLGWVGVGGGYVDLINTECTRTQTSSANSHEAAKGGD
ncbi:WD repeat-containing protein 25 [Collichthys lucidus]|uniref:WD repeat-containing protein 25 n=1 Tax=Collichthys lucidus TaxID=240159 RepID=A0A4U5VFD0_COLLU|nr:WD repeat-containing protein 25 [Collichthys lucidus]